MKQCKNVMDGGVWQITRSVIIILHLLPFCTCYFHSRSQKAHNFSHVCFPASHTVLPPAYMSGLPKPQYIFVCQRYPQLSWKRQLLLSKVQQNNCKMRQISKHLPMPYDFSRLWSVKAFSGDPRRLKLHWCILPCPTTMCPGPVCGHREAFFSGLGNFHSSLGETDSLVLTLSC